MYSTGLKIHVWDKRSVILVVHRHTAQPVKNVTAKIYFVVTMVTKVTQNVAFLPQNDCILFGKVFWTKYNYFRTKIQLKIGCINQ